MKCAKSIALAKRVLFKMECRQYKSLWFGLDWQFGAQELHLPGLYMQPWDQDERAGKTGMIVVWCLPYHVFRIYVHKWWALYLLDARMKCCKQLSEPVWAIGRALSWTDAMDTLNGVQRNDDALFAWRLDTCIENRATVEWTPWWYGWYQLSIGARVKVSKLTPRSDDNYLVYVRGSSEGWNQQLLAADIMNEIWLWHATA